MNNRNKHSDPDSQLYSAILKLQTVEECYDFFTDLCTFSELKAMEQRFELAKLLNDGLIYNDILEKTGASSATISRGCARGSKCSRIWFWIWPAARVHCPCCWPGTDTG